MKLFANRYWSDRDATPSGEGLCFSANGNRWFLPEHGISTSTCRWWAHYLPAKGQFIAYEVEYMLHLIETIDPRVMYTPTKSKGWPTNRGYLIPVTIGGLHVFSVHRSFNGEPLLGMPRGKAGKLAELHFVGTVFVKNKAGEEINFAEAWQDTKGNDVRLPNGEWVQVKLDREASNTGNLWVQTHTRTKDTQWLASA